MIPCTVRARIPICIKQISFLGQNTGLEYGLEFQASRINCAKMISHQQCFFFSRNIGYVTPKNIYFHYLLKNNPGQSIQKRCCFISKTEALVISRQSLYYVCKYIYKLMEQARFQMSRYLRGKRIQWNRLISQIDPLHRKISCKLMHWKLDDVVLQYLSYLDCMTGTLSGAPCQVHPCFTTSEIDAMDHVRSLSLITTDDR